MHKKILEALSALQELMRTHDKVLNGLQNVPDAVRAQIKELSDGIGALMKELAQAPLIAADLAPEWSAKILGQLHEFISKQNATLSSSLTRTVELNHDLTANFIRKEEHKQLVDSAREDGKKAAQAELLPMLTAMRKQTVELAGLPMPADEVLGLPAEEFTARFDTCKATVKSCGQRGLDGKHVTTLRVAWLDKDKVTCELKELDALGFKEKEGNSQPNENPDPLKGGRRQTEDVFEGEVIFA